MTTKRKLWIDSKEKRSMSSRVCRVPEMASFSIPSEKAEVFVLKPYAQFSWSTTCVFFQINLQPCACFFVLEKRHPLAGGAAAPLFVLVCDSKMTAVSFCFKGNISANTAKLNLTRLDMNVKITGILYNNWVFLILVFVQYKTCRVWPMEQTWSRGAWLNNRVAFQRAHTESIASFVDSWLKAYLPWFPIARWGKYSPASLRWYGQILLPTAFLSGF